MTAGTATLTEFLLARIAEDEAVDAAWSGTLPEHRTWHFDDNDDGPPREVYEYDRGFGSSPIAEIYEPSLGVGKHIARHDPARVLAECESKRAIVALVRPDPSMPVDSGRFVSAAEVLTLLGLPYADHPDYQGGLAVDDQVRVGPA